MSKFLKGNYEIPGDGNPGKATERTKITNEEKNQDDKDFTKLFEEEALKKLGGSIAFVMKSNKLIWDKNEDAK